MPDRHRLVVPQQLQEQVLNEHHDSIFAGHFGIKKMTQRLSQYYYWKGMKADVHKKCMSGVTCASVSGQGCRSKPPLKNITVGGVFECLRMDFKEMDLSHSGNHYALVFQDYLSKWPEVYAVPDRKAEIVAEPQQELYTIRQLSSYQKCFKRQGIEQLPTSGAPPDRQIGRAVQ